MSATAASTAPQNKSLEWMNRLRANPKIPLIVAGAAAIAIVVAMVLWAKSPDYRTLYSNLSDQDGGAIVTQLTQMNIPYRFADNGGRGCRKAARLGLSCWIRKNSASVSSASRLTTSARWKVSWPVRLKP